MKVKSPKYIKLLVKKYNITEQAIISKELITTTENARMNSFIRDITKKYSMKGQNTIKPIIYKNLANINVIRYFKTDSCILKLEAKENFNPIEFKISFYDNNPNSLKFNKQKVTTQTGIIIMLNWIKASIKGIETEKDIPRDSFYFMNEVGDYTICKNFSGKCECENFKTEKEANRYLQGWSHKEIKLGKRW